MAVRTQSAGQATESHWLMASGVALAAVLAANAFASGHHWWANFVLFPGAALGAAAVPLFRRGRVAGGYALSCVAAIVCAVGVLLLFGGMAAGWPLMIIVPCLAVAGTARWRPGDPNARATHRTVVGLALLAVLLGLTFLALGAGAVDLGDVRWWSFVMMAAGAIAVGNGLSLAGDLRGYRLSTMVLLTGIGAATILAGLRELLWR